MESLKKHCANWLYDWSDWVSSIEVACVCMIVWNGRPSSALRAIINIDWSFVHSIYRWRFRYSTSAGWTIIAAHIISSPSAWARPILTHLTMTSLRYTLLETRVHIGEYLSTTIRFILIDVRCANQVSTAASLFVSPLESRIAAQGYVSDMYADTRRSTSRSAAQHHSRSSTPNSILQPAQRASSRYRQTNTSASYIYWSYLIVYS